MEVGDALLVPQLQFDPAFQGRVAWSGADAFGVKFVGQIQAGYHVSSKVVTSGSLDPPVSHPPELSHSEPD